MRLVYIYIDPYLLETIHPYLQPYCGPLQLCSLSCILDINLNQVAKTGGKTLMSSNCKVSFHHDIHGLVSSNYGFKGQVCV